MRAIRLAFGTVVMALLALGYAASQRAYFAGEAPRYAAAVDTPAVKLTALVVLLGVVVLAFLPDRDQEADSE